VKEFIEEISATNSSVCPCIVSLKFIRRTLEKEAKNLSSFCASLKPTNINEDRGYTELKRIYIKAQCLYGLGSFLMRAFYDGVAITSITFVGNIYNHMVYDVNDDIVLKIFIHPYIQMQNTRTYSLQYEQLYPVYYSFKESIEAVNSLKTFMKVEAYNMTAYELPNKTGNIPNNINYTMWRAHRRYKPFSKPGYQQRIQNREACWDIFDIAVDLETLRTKGFTYNAFCLKNIFFDEEGKLLIGDIQIDKCGTSYIHMYKIGENAEISFIDRNKPEQNLSFSFAMLLILVCNIFSSGTTEEICLQNFYKNDKDTFRILYPIVACEELYKTLKINVFMYPKFFKILVIIYALYLVRGEAKFIKSDCKEFNLLADFLSRPDSALQNYDLSNINSKVKQKAENVLQNGRHNKTLTALIETINQEIYNIKDTLSPKMNARDLEPGGKFIHNKRKLTAILDNFQ
jgi:hypothetical protein